MKHQSWNPLWSVGTILTGLYSFMIETNPTLGSIETSTRKKRQLAALSLEFNVKNSPLFCKLFPQYVERYEEELRLLGENKANAASNTFVNTSRMSLSAGAPPLANARGDALPQAFIAALAGIAAILSIVMAVRFL